MMRNAYSQRVRSSISAGASHWRILICCLAAFGLSVVPATAQSGDDSALKIVGPLAAKELVEDLAVEFNKKTSQPSAGLDYTRIDVPGAASGALAAGRDVLFSCGKVDERRLGSAKKRWQELDAAEHVVSARAVAIVVHPRNPVESLTLDQLQAIYSGKTEDWSVYGGSARAVRCYGLAFRDPITLMFQERVLPATKCTRMTRKKDSADIIKALTSDPQGIGYVDAVVASEAGGTVRTVPIATAASALAASSEAVAPNAQTIKNGQYILSETLVMYVSPEASAAGQRFVKFILDGGGDAVFRKHGFIPTIRAVRADVLAAFEKLYGPDLKRVKATEDTADDLALASLMLRSARTTKLDPELIKAMCDAAYDLTSGFSGGETVALEALGLLGSKIPDERFRCATKRVELCERVYAESQSPRIGLHLVDALMETADMGTSFHQFAEAAQAWKRALAVAEEANSPKLSLLKRRLPAFEARVTAGEQADMLVARLENNPKDKETRRQLLRLYLTELDDPQEAAKYLDVAADDATLTNVPLAAEPVDKLGEDAALNVAEWYVNLSNKAGAGGKELMVARAKQYYEQFFKVHEPQNKDGGVDLLAMRATLGMQKVGGDAPVEGDGKEPSRPVIKADLAKGEEITDLKLAEFVAAHPKLTRLGRREIGTARQLTDLRPLTRLEKLESLELHDARSLKDLSPLAKLPSLTFLRITGLEADNISGLAGMSVINRLEILEAKDLKDLSPLSRLLRLRQLSLRGCDQIADLKPLASLTDLTRLDLAGCESVKDIEPLAKLTDLERLDLGGCKEIKSIKPLSGLSRNLTWLSLNGTAIDDIIPLARMHRLEYLDLRGCRKLSADDITWLTKRLADCKVLTDKPPAKPKEPANATSSVTWATRDDGGGPKCRAALRFPGSAGQRTN